MEHNSAIKLILQRQVEHNSAIKCNNCSINSTSTECKIKLVLRVKADCNCAEFYYKAIIC